MLKKTLGFVCACLLSAPVLAEDGDTSNEAAWLLGMSQSQTAALGTQAEPDARELRSARKYIEGQYKDRLWSRDPKDKASFAQFLFQQAKKSSDDPVSQAALLDLSLDLATDRAVADIALVLDLCDYRAATFAGLDPIELKREALKELRTHKIAKAMLSLLDNPDDAAASGVVGLYLYFVSQDADTALTMMAQSDVAEIAAVAELEKSVEAFNLAKVAHDRELDRYQTELHQWEMTIRGLEGEELEAAMADQPAEPAPLDQGDAKDSLRPLGDAWLELGEEMDDFRDYAWARSLEYYREVIGGMDGISKAKLQDQIEDMEVAIPLHLSKMDLDNLSVRQWEKIESRSFTVKADKYINETGIRLAPGQRVRVVPHPTDTWVITGGSGDRRYNWKGRVRDDGGEVEETTYWTYDYRRHGTMVALLSKDGTPTESLTVTGPGPLLLKCWIGNGYYYYGGSQMSGSIRAKVIPLAAHVE